MNISLLPLAFGFREGSEWILIVLVVLILFGAKRLPDMAKSLGQGIKEFKKALRESGEDTTTKDANTASPNKPAAPAAPETTERKIAAPTSAASNGDPSKS